MDSVYVLTETTNFRDEIQVEVYGSLTRGLAELTSVANSGYAKAAEAHGKDNCKRKNLDNVQIIEIHTEEGTFNIKYELKEYEVLK